MALRQWFPSNNMSLSKWKKLFLNGPVINPQEQSYKKISISVCDMKNKISIEPQKLKSQKDRTSLKSELENEKFMKLRLDQMRLSSETTWYPHKFQNTMTVSEFIDRFSAINPEDKLPENHVRLCGRVKNIRKQGKQLSFVDLYQDQSTVQIKLKADFYSGNFDEEITAVKRGDVIGVEGLPIVTKSGALALLTKNMTLLAPTLKLIPSNSLGRIEHRYRRRHVDLLTNPDTRCIFKTRAHILKLIRAFLDERDFIEVETPILTIGVGGANAEAFKTHHNDLEMDMCLRIAPELHLKTLLVGGFDRVYEIGRQFRNEGLDSSHNPEFTSCEFYMAYSDYNDILELTQLMFSHIAKTLRELPSTPNLDSNSVLYEKLINQPYEKIDFLLSLESATGVKFPNAIDLSEESDEAVKFLSDLCEKNDIKIIERRTSKILDKLFSKLIEPTLEHPTFVLHHPMCMCPLAKEHRSVKGISERFELFAKGLEVVNAYTELNDPMQQKLRFKKQRQSELTDYKETSIEKDFVNALEYGLPPTAGWGLGVDRLVMLLTNQRSIREVLLFPTMKPK